MTHIPKKTSFRLSFRNKTKNKRILKHDFKQKHACANQAQPFLKSPIFFEKDPYLKLNYSCIKTAYRCLTLNRNIAYTPFFNVYGEKLEFKRTLESDRKNRSSHCVTRTMHVFQNESELAPLQLTSVLNTQFLTQAKHDILKRNAITYTKKPIDLATTNQLCQSVKTTRPRYSSVFFNRRNQWDEIRARTNQYIMGKNKVEELSPTHSKSYGKTWEKKPPLFFLSSSNLRRNKACKEIQFAKEKSEVFSKALFFSSPGTSPQVINQNITLPKKQSFLTRGGEVRIVRRRRSMSVLAYKQGEKSVKRVDFMHNFSNRDTCHSNVLFGVYGICFERHGTLTAAYIETVGMEGAKLRKKGRAWLRLCCNTPVTARPIETRMGKGKGTISYWEVKVRPGQVFLELAGISKTRLGQLMENLRKKCSMRFRLISF